ncbi:uncharacterized protein Z518_01983 [Rhinocladiella mackenziei CBS 650.93]|uniref:Zn(2)-C6 fungal-type domain-containing protein n=1 Tax=Rhinocladiella mackenziei CBS 650.93 TaxID=1442369 RepID=A0A0D2JDP6_9EURO|nr:uncharacterized protein Z518_01983 [Rhinocladiella mackenziei CBS 650.93]KIX07330.1 hypothetical protein Z518_01983 [Rhinocladiella mackenziei CBS 650.93]
MVYYGVCDQRKPGCLKCEKSDKQCPGYRNLDEVLFRDESERIIRKARPIEPSKSVLIPKTRVISVRSPTSGAPTSEPKLLTSSLYPVSISYPLSQPINELGANFFFTKYTFNEAPFANDYHDWLTQSYFEDGPSHVLRAAIEAVGMAGISNVSHAPHVASKSKVQYCEALAALKQALKDPVQASADTTFMAVILLGLFEAVNFEHWDRYPYWAAHVKGATALLQLRGREQFTRERGGQLYIQIRSQILLVCMQQHNAVPPALVQTTYDFQTSAIRQQWQHRRVASPGSICEISFRMVNLRAAFKNGEVTDPQVIRKTALEIDGDLEVWRAGVPPNWRYTTIDAPGAGVDTCFDGKSHVYPTPWIADAWNNWRILRILVNQIIVQNEVRSSVPENAQKSIALSIIRQSSADICISTSSFIGTPRKFPPVRSRASTPLNILRRYPFSDPAIICCVPGRAECSQCAFLRRTPIAPHRGIDGNSTGWLDS